MSVEALFSDETLSISFIGTVIYCAYLYVEYHLMPGFPFLENLVDYQFFIQVFL